jgi:hypothetical protein
MRGKTLTGHNSIAQFSTFSAFIDPACQFLRAFFETPIGTSVAPTSVEGEQRALS